MSFIKCFNITEYSFFYSANSFLHVYILGRCIKGLFWNILCILIILMQLHNTQQNESKPSSLIALRLISSVRFFFFNPNLKWCFHFDKRLLIISIFFYRFDAYWRSSYYYIHQYSCTSICVIERDIVTYFTYMYNSQCFGFP